LAAAGIDTVSVAGADIFAFGVTPGAITGSGAAVAVAVGTAGTATTGATLITAIAGGITEVANETFLIAITDSGTGNTFSGLYLVAAYDTTFSSNDILVKLIGTNVSGNDTIAINAATLVYTVVA
jgi:hypothetical protein